MDEWDEGMEYLEEYGDAEAEAMEDAAADAQGEAEADAAIAEARDSDDIEKVREALDNLIADRLARREGEKPAREWTRADFANTLRRHKELQKLSTPELRALFLAYVETINGIEYYRRESVRDARRFRAVGGCPAYALAIPAATLYAAENMDDDGGAYRRKFAEEKKLAVIWQKL